MLKILNCCNPALSLYLDLMLFWLFNICVWLVPVKRRSSTYRPLIFCVFRPSWCTETGLHVCYGSHWIKHKPRKYWHQSFNVFWYRGKYYIVVNTLHLHKCFSKKKIFSFCIRNLRINLGIMRTTYQDGVSASWELCRFNILNLFNDANSSRVASFQHCLYSKATASIYEKDVVMWPSFCTTLLASPLL